MKPFETLSMPVPGRVFHPGDEQVFKVWHMNSVAKMIGHAATAFQIENEEKEPGFPDALIDIQGMAPLYIEYKVSDNKGVIEFQKAQPRFYKQHAGMPIYVVAYSVPDDAYYVFKAAHVLHAMVATDRSKPLRVRIMGGSLV